MASGSLQTAPVFEVHESKTVTHVPLSTRLHADGRLRIGQSEDGQSGTYDPGGSSRGMVGCRF